MTAHKLANNFYAYVLIDTNQALQTIWQWLDIFDNVLLFNFNVAEAGHNRILVVSQSARFFCD